MATPTLGRAVKSAPSPAAVTSAIDPIPSAVPRTCRRVARNPNVAPDAQSRTVLGPGVTEMTTMKPTSARSVPIASPSYRGQRPEVLYDPAVVTPADRPEIRA